MTSVQRGDGGQMSGPAKNYNTLHYPLNDHSVIKCKFVADWFHISEFLLSPLCIFDWKPQIFISFFSNACWHCNKHLKQPMNLQHWRAGWSLDIHGCTPDLSLHKILPARHSDLNHTMIATVWNLTEGRSLCPCVCPGAALPGHSAARDNV